MKTTVVGLALACLLAAAVEAQEPYGTSADMFIYVCAGLCGSGATTGEAVASLMQENRMRPSALNTWEKADSLGVTSALVIVGMKMATFVFTPKRQTPLPPAILSTLLGSRGRVDFTVYPGEIAVEFPLDTTRFGQNGCSCVDTVVLRMQDGAWLRTHRMFHWK